MVFLKNCLELFVIVLSLEKERERERERRLCSLDDEKVLTLLTLKECIFPNQ